MFSEHMNVVIKVETPFNAEKSGFLELDLPPMTYFSVRHRSFISFETDLIKARVWEFNLQHGRDCINLCNFM